MRKFTTRKTGTILTGIAVILAITAMACGTEPEGAARDSGADAVTGGAAQGIAVGELHPDGDTGDLSGTSLTMRVPCESDEALAVSSRLQPIMPADGVAVDDAAPVDVDKLIDRTEVEARGEVSLAGEPCMIDNPLTEKDGVASGMDGQATNMYQTVIRGGGSNDCLTEVMSTTETIAPSVDDTVPAGTLTPEELEKLIDRTEVEVSSVERDGGDEPVALCVGGDAVTTLPVEETTVETTVEALEEK